MPIYEYACDTCGGEFEKLISVSAPTPTCPSCDTASHVRKLISATSFILKGSGWYKDHYGLKKSGGANGESSGDASGGESKSATASVSTPSDTASSTASTKTETKATPASTPSSSTPSGG